MARLPLHGSAPPLGKRAAAEFPSSPPAAFGTRLVALAKALEESGAHFGPVAVIAQRSDAAAGFDPPPEACELLLSPLPQELSAFCASSQSAWRIRFLLGLREEPKPVEWDALAAEIGKAGAARLCLIPHQSPGDFPSHAAFPLRCASWRGEVELSCSVEEELALRLIGETPFRNAQEAMALAERFCGDASSPPGSAVSPPEFAELIPGVERLREEMRAGNCYLANLCTRIAWPGSAPFRNAADFIRAWLRDAPRFGAWIDLPDCGVASFTPERFLMRRGDHLLTEPIKGTRACDPAEPEAGARWLWSSVKEMAEHRMVVDLLRNDLNLVCEPGSVGVWRPFHVQPRQGLHQMQSWVHGRVDAGLSHADILRSTLPAGSVTGTPKRAACRLLEGIEGTQRGYYTGVLFLSEADGGFDSWLLIRSFFRTGEEWSVGVGAGVTTLSEARAEAEECRGKWASIAWRAIPQGACGEDLRRREERTA